MFEFPGSFSGAFEELAEKMVAMRGLELKFPQLVDFELEGVRGGRLVVW